MSFSRAQAPVPRIGNYFVEDHLGRGGMGVVYEGRHASLDRKVAIKQLDPNLTRNREFQERFFSEARTHSTLQHPNIVTLYDFLEVEGDFFIVMELVDGQALDQLLTGYPSGLPLDFALSIGRQLLQALQAAHSAGVVHRDVKPSNVLLTRDGRVKLGDFGIAFLVGDVRLTRSSASVGTPLYKSPEQIQRPREIDYRTDIYSAGIVFFETLTGRPPFEADGEFELYRQHIEDPLPDISEYRSGIPAEILSAIQRATAKRPEDRFESADEFTWALTVPTGGARSADSGRSRWTVGLAILLGALVTFLLVVFLVHLLARQESTPRSLSERAALQSRRSLEAIQPIDDVSSPESVQSSGKAEPTGPEDTGSNQSSAEATKPDAARSQRRETQGAPKKTPTTPSSPLPTAQEVRERRARSVQKRVREALVESRRALEEGEPERAGRLVSELLQFGAAYPEVLADELVELRLLQAQITSARVDLRMQVREEQLRMQQWARRLDEIDELLDDKRYPEARQLSQSMLDEEDLPEAIRLRCEEAYSSAQSGLESIFAGTEWGEVESKVEDSKGDG